jgi:hypothetical protein
MLFVFLSLIVPLYQAAAESRWLCFANQPFATSLSRVVKNEISWIDHFEHPFVAWQALQVLDTTVCIFTSTTGWVLAVRLPVF